MFGIENLMLFIISGLLLNMTPGADVLYILSRSASNGFKGGAVAALGIGAGCGVHVIGATVGISALIASSATLFTVVKWLGGAYLVFIGFKMIFSRQKNLQKDSVAAETSLKNIFWQGFMTNALNPKVAIFFIAFLPQFISASSDNYPMAMLTLGIIFNINGTLWNLIVAWTASAIASQLNHSGIIKPWLNRFVGSLFLYFGLSLAITAR
ncbi:LysE family translocator [Pseudoalteromonas sp. UCD-33C]|uniref:LysE family translocator n=1 Tax=Pseudoalteromonas sp. UCD-33C TaxID=1716175 RepID=UPI0006CA5A1F|nr:LysE family translocator [Pseudoalteromonas sp. UCD-33C]KPM77514.1 lysine transporter LysE [Pseudoalteromonas sp. UCD-33C]